MHSVASQSFIPNYSGQSNSNMMPNTVIRFSNSAQPPSYHSEMRQIHHIRPHYAPTLITSSPKPQSPQINFNQYPQSSIHAPVPQLHSTISFGNHFQTSPPELAKLSLNGNDYKYTTVNAPEHHIPQQYTVQTRKRPELVENPSKLLRETRSSKNLKTEVKTFNVDTSDVQTLKQNEFTGCFHCFSPVTYSTKNSKLC